MSSSDDHLHILIVVGINQKPRLGLIVYETACRNYSNIFDNEDEA